MLSMPYSTRDSNFSHHRPDWRTGLNSTRIGKLQCQMDDLRGKLDHIFCGETGTFCGSTFPEQDLLACVYCSHTHHPKEERKDKDLHVTGRDQQQMNQGMIAQLIALAGDKSLLLRVQEDQLREMAVLCQLLASSEGLMAFMESERRTLITQIEALELEQEQLLTQRAPLGPDLPSSQVQCKRHREPHCSLPRGFKYCCQPDTKREGRLLEAAVEDNCKEEKEKKEDTDAEASREIKSEQQCNTEANSLSPSAVTKQQVATSL
ncbi:hypothetical protein GN956_G10329 [Arapaima gigas]